MPRVMFYVQHLWGVGHVYRATRIAQGLRKNGFEVHLVWGGTRIPGFDFTGLDVHYLPAVRTSDVSFSRLLHADGTEFSDADRKNRASALLGLFEKISPDILMTEAFPFGRRQMRFELLPLLEKAGSQKFPPMIAASIRDIMQEGRKEKRVAESVELVRKHFDLVLVHGDENMIAIAETLQGVEHFSDKIRYTGLVTPQQEATPLSDEYNCDVLVTVGGGAFGQRLTRTAIKAMAFSRVFPSNWIVSAGSEMPEADYQALIDTAPKGMKIVRYIPNLANVMRQAKISVSHAGYNTVGDVLKSGCAAVLYPYTDGNETEQLRRAQIMHERGIAVMLDPRKCTAENLGHCVDHSAGLKRNVKSFNLDGARGTASILMAEYKKHVGNL